ncbi:uncharacterized protein Peritrophin-15b [Drosophila takahashii]|uniref:uncharacterized protein Peritrophin-15b n=1 Tax=Drosophila takahashii TaxID=29030 RepID=UPI001CF7F6F1|nr:uncharacterized protein LOC108062586 [Drosophila takahashii]
MKAVVVLLFLALFVAIHADYVCNPDGDGKPDSCLGRTGQVSRDFWDPTHYWICAGAGEPELAACDDQTGFDPKTGKCVPWNLWQWYPPCPTDSTD